MMDATTHMSLIAAVENYFEVMFDSDVGRFDQVFAFLKRGTAAFDELKSFF